MKILLDTCSIIWAVASPDHLSNKALRLFQDNETEFYVSPMSGAELACAVERKKLMLKLHWKMWFRKYIEEFRWNIIEIDLTIIEEAYSLPGKFHQDPVDRILVATSRLHQCKLMTADKLILKYPHVETVW